MQARWDCALYTLPHLHELSLGVPIAGSDPKEDFPFAHQC